MSKLGTILRAVRSPASNSAAARGSPVRSATSHSPTSDWMKPLRIVSPGANEYCAYSVPFGPGRGRPVGVALLEHLQPGRDLREQLVLAAELDRGARDRLQPGALREAAHPRRRAAVEAEVVLPRQPAAARDGDRHQLVEQQRVARVVALGALRVRVQLPEVRERVELEALPREVLEDELGARERDARAVASSGCADQYSALRWSWRKSGEEPARAQLPRAAIPSVVARTPASSVAPRAGQAPDPALDVGQDRAVGVVGRLVDRARPVELAQLGRDRLLLRRLRGRRRAEQRQRRAPAEGQCARNRLFVSGPWMRC